MHDEKNIVEAQVFDEVQGRYNGPQLEQRILKFWEEHAIFEKSLAQSACKPRFSFNEGPPTANGKPGIHHVLARAFKDIYPRYKTMRGYYAPRKGGWDTHGLPVEHEIEKQLGIFDKKEIESQVGVAEFNRRCRESVMTYIGEWERMTRRMGYWVNLDQAYYTLDNDYIESTWNLLKRIWDKGLIYKGYKVVPYDPRIGATLSSHEVAQGYRGGSFDYGALSACRRGQHFAAGVDHHAVDLAVQLATGGGRGYRLRARGRALIFRHMPLR